ncbi:3-phosphoshikimate 1-carboxyvinyltransferase [Pseudoflavonifractor phocaeensis]|uniref:3-phosphoshikimate 1-carboxyvinyltransferase n=1 Tax=Pseudoflavonifractor phocaeensis TaxID=1870988 RepID=UPI00195B3368|nr:3-phosphoshikimate 1-carboxyvinyltransferase [Pseudoflavonifractor phocaeensis]MBM6924981.1 3-phosphoshikimate 1-carboxyvinyltransferase [Pseudoflavonifractor phocaeensis]
MRITVTPTLLKGTITPPSSKSQAHRLIIAAALGAGESHIGHITHSQDIDATLRCMAALKEPGEDLPLLDCGESGSTLRFLIPVALALRGGGRFTGRGRLMERPQEPYFALFRERGISYRQAEGMLTVEGRLEPGDYVLPGDVSSQFITGLLYALPLLPGDSRILLTTPLESRGYVDMTLDALEQFGVRADYDGESTFRVPGNQTYQARDLTVEADWSNAAFWYAAISLGCDLEIQGLNAFSTQGDMCIVPYYMKLQGEGPVELDVSQCPDLVPPLAAMAALRRGQVTHIVNAGRLRIKESDRLATVTQVLGALGGQVEEHPDALTITGKDRLPGGVEVSGHNDHRIAMMAAIAAIRCEEPVTIDGAECVQKSYPEFWRDYEALGGRIARG